MATAVAAAAWALLAPRIPQEPAYHPFADHRTILGAPNAPNVLSNLAFAVAGRLGIRAVLSGRARFADPRERWPWLVPFVAVALTCLVSAWYNLDPSNHALVWDRLPVAVWWFVTEGTGGGDLRPNFFVQFVALRAFVLGNVAAAGTGAVAWMPGRRRPLPGLQAARRGVP